MGWFHKLIYCNHEYEFKIITKTGEYIKICKKCGDEKRPEKIEYK